VVDIRTLVNVEHLYGVGLLVDAADDPVGSPPRAVTASQRAEERPAYPAWLTAKAASQNSRTAAATDSGSRSAMARRAAAWNLIS